MISELSEDIRPGQADRSPSVRLTLPAVASNVALIRQVLAGLADDLGVDTAQCADMKIAVTEACTNVVVHAYPGDYGPVETEMTLLAQGLVVSVRDRGTDFKPSMPLAPNPATQSGDSALGFGLSLIAELSDEFAIRAGASGTEVQMLFAVLSAAVPDPMRPTPDFARVFADTSQLARDGPAPGDGIMLAITPGVPTTSVFGRLISLLAARADFSIDRLSDAQLVSDALATGAAARSADQLVRIGVTERETATGSPSAFNFFASSSGARWTLSKSVPSQHSPQARQSCSPEFTPHHPGAGGRSASRGSKDPGEIFYARSPVQA